MEDDFIPDGASQTEDDFQPDTPDMQGKIEPHENVLQRVIKNSRIGPIGGTSIAAALPASGQEAMDLAKVAGRTIPGFFGVNTRGGSISPATQGPAGIGMNMAGIKEAKPLISEPETPYGKNMEAAADIAPWAAMGMGAATSGAKGINRLFSKGSLPQEVETAKGSMQDLVKLGPEKVKGRVSDIFNEFQNHFGKEIEKVNGFLHSGHFEEALRNTADDLGAVDVPGSPGYNVAKLADSFKDKTRLFTAPEIQAQTKELMKSFDHLTKSKFYNHFTQILSKEFPELSNLKASYAPVYDIANKSKFINSGRLGRAASGKMGPEELGRMAEAEQMLGDEPGVVSKTVEASDALNDKQNQLQKIIGRRNALGSIGKTFARGIPYGAGAGVGGAALWKALRD